MTRGVLALGIGGAIVAALVLILVFWSHDETPAPQVTSHRPAGPTNPDQRRTRPSAPDPASPPPAGDPASSGNDRERTLGDVVVRDHRTGDHPVVDVPPSMNAPGGRRIPPQLTFAISQQVEPLLTECGGKNIPADARGAKPRFEGQIQISIKDRRAQVIGATFQLRDVTGDFDAVRTCVEQRAIGLFTPSADEPDLPTYTITTSLRLP